MKLDLIGRRQELAQVGEWVSQAAAGQGRLALIRGEAGVGKTTLALAALDGQPLKRIHVAANGMGTRPFGLIRDALRAAGVDPAHTESGDLQSPIVAAVAEMADRGPVAILLDDLQAADAATLDVLASWADELASKPALVIGTYRTEDVARGHPVRQLRSLLNRRRRLHEITLGSLDEESTAQLLERRLGQRPSDRLRRLIFERTEGLPFFVEEIAAALVESGSLQAGPTGLELAGEASLPLPESIRDAIHQRVDRLSFELREVLTHAAVQGTVFELALLPDAPIADAEPLLATGLVAEGEDRRRFAFRHALIRDAIYEAIPWTRRRTLHAQLARRQEQAGESAGTVARHWVAAGDQVAGRRWLLAAGRESFGAGAFRDATDELGSALDLWPPGEELPARLEALELLARGAELSGETRLGVRALIELAELVQGTGDEGRYGEAQRRLAGLLELQGSWERAIVARQAAASAFLAAARPAEAAAERLAAASRLRSAGSFRAALDLIIAGIDEARVAGRPDLDVRLRALEGNVRARAGDADGGLSIVRSALADALAVSDFAGAAEAYQRLADALEHGGYYRQARSTYYEAADFCRSNAEATMGDVCLACLTMVLRQTGEWGEALRLADDVIASPSSNAHAQAVAHGVKGSILAHRGRYSHARPELHASSVIADRIGLAAMEIDSATHLARVAFANERTDDAIEACWRAVRRWKLTDRERHYSLPNLRWIATLAAQTGDRDLLGACAEALTSVATAADVEAQAAADHTLAEGLLLDGDADAAIERFERARSGLADAGLPFDRAEVELRAAAAYLRASKPKEALELYRDAHRVAVRLGARPLATFVASAVAAMGEKLERRLGRRAASAAVGGGLSPRELEVARLVARGYTSREAAAELSLSPRTIEMHVHRILGKLDCRRRIDITRRAAELGLLA